MFFDQKNYFFQILIHFTPKCDYFPLKIFPPPINSGNTILKITSRKYKPLQLNQNFNSTNSGFIHNRLPQITTNSIFIIPIFLQPDSENLLYLKLRFVILENIKGLFILEISEEKWENKKIIILMTCWFCLTLMQV